MYPFCFHDMKVRFVLVMMEIDFALILFFFFASVNLRRQNNFVT